MILKNVSASHWLWIDYKYEKSLILLVNGPSFLTRKTFNMCQPAPNRKKWNFKINFCWNTPTIYVQVFNTNTSTQGFRKITYGLSLWPESVQEDRSVRKETPEKHPREWQQSIELSIVSYSFSYTPIYIYTLNL